jgi:hypothetical protein
MAPRQADTEYLAEAARKEERASMSASQRFAADKRALLTQVRQLFPGDKRAVPAVAKAFDRKTAVDGVRTKARNSDEYNRTAFMGEVDVLASWGVMDAKDAQKAKAWAETASEGEIKDGRRYLQEHEFDDAYLSTLRYVKQATEQKSS